MLDVILIIIGALCMIAGLAGCILPFLPGPPIAYLGLFILHCTDKVGYSTTQLIVWLLIVVVLQVLDYFTPMLGSKYSGGSKWGNWGCVIGTLAGLLFLPWGIILGPFLGAVIGELLGNKEFSQALKSGFGSLIGFILGTLLKLVVCGYFCYQFIAGFCLININKAALRKEEQLYCFVYFISGSFHRNLVDTFLMTSSFKLGREKLG